MTNNFLAYPEAARPDTDLQDFSPTFEGSGSGFNNNGMLGVGVKSS